MLKWSPTNRWGLVAVLGLSSCVGTSTAPSPSSQPVVATPLAAVSIDAVPVAPSPIAAPPVTAVPPSLKLDPVVAEARDLAEQLLAAIANEDVDASIVILPLDGRSRERREQILKEWRSHTGGVTQVREIRARGAQWAAHVRDEGNDVFVVMLERDEPTHWTFRGLKSPSPKAYRALPLVWRLGAGLDPPPQQGEDDEAFHHNLHDLCLAHQGINADPKLDTEVKRMNAMVERFRPQGPLLEFLMSIAGVPTNSRYPRILVEARRRGVPSWSCPAILAHKKYRR